MRLGPLQDVEGCCQPGTDVSAFPLGHRGQSGGQCCHVNGVLALPRQISELVERHDAEPVSRSQRTRQTGDGRHGLGPGTVFRHGTRGIENQNIIRWFRRHTNCVRHVRHLIRK